jgi:hypothetical protein
VGAVRAARAAAEREREYGGLGLSASGQEMGQYIFSH